RAAAKQEVPAPPAEPSIAAPDTNLRQVASTQRRRRAPVKPEPQPADATPTAVLETPSTAPRPARNAPRRAARKPAVVEPTAATTPTEVAEPSPASSPDLTSAPRPRGRTSSGRSRTVKKTETPVLAEPSPEAAAAEPLVRAPEKPYRERRRPQR